MIGYTVGLYIHIFKRVKISIMGKHIDMGASKILLPVE